MNATDNSGELHPKKGRLIDVSTPSQASREIMGYVPHWIIRAGITVVFVVIILLLIAAWFFKYPDIIKAKVTLTAENPPATVVARSDGKLDVLFVEDKQKVVKGQWLGVIENTAYYIDVGRLKRGLQSYENRINNEIAIDIDSIDKHLHLGELQASYYNFLNAYNDLQIFRRLKYFPDKINNLNRELSLKRSHYLQMGKQQSILEKDLFLSREDYLRDSVLYSAGSIAKTEYEQRLSAHLQKQFGVESYLLELSGAKIQLLQLEQKLLDAKLDFEEKGVDVRIRYFEAYENLLSLIGLWEQKFVIKAPIDGIVTFFNIWNVNHNVRVGEKVMTIVPETPSKMHGRMLLPVKGSGKVKPGLDVKIRFSNFPPSEYGVVRGTVGQISLVPEDDHYFVEVSLPDGLTTTYHKDLEFHPEMKGEAEIITEDVRLLMRVMRPFKALLRNN